MTPVLLLSAVLLVHPGLNTFPYKGPPWPPQEMPQTERVFVALYEESFDPATFLLERKVPADVRFHSFGVSSTLGVIYRLESTAPAEKTVRLVVMELRDVPP